MPELPRLCALRYLQPLREGGSLPAVADTDGGFFVVKFRGAGQGAKALVAELIVGMLAQTLELPVPELALVDLAEEFGRGEPDPEIQDLLRLSRGLNVGLRYLDGAFNFDPSAAGSLVSPELAARVVWLDALVTNPDRTHRNPNLLIWERRPWLIDHGAALYVHHNWGAADPSRARSPFPLIEKHVLLGQAGDLHEADRVSAPRLDEAAIEGILQALPDELLDHADPDADRGRYRDFLLRRLQEPRAFVATAAAARERALSETPKALGSRR